MTDQVSAAYHRFLEKQHEPQYMRNVIIGLSAVMIFFTLPFMICTFVAASTANQGFNVVLTGLLLLVWEVGTIALMKKGPQPMSHGALIGVSVVFFFLTFQTAVYWGQMAGCDDSSDYSDVDQYTCENKAAMRGVCAFAVLIWLVQLPFTALVIQHRNTVIKEASYDDMGPAGQDYAYDQNSGGNTYGYAGPPATGAAGGGVDSTQDL